MAGDIRDLPPPSASPSTGAKSTSQLPVYEAFNIPESEKTSAPPPLPVAEPIGTKEKYSLSEGLKTIRWQDFGQVHMYPCFREAGLTGIGIGFGVGGLRALFGASIWKACNWAVGSLVLGAVGSHELCSYRRRYEQALVKRAVEIQERKKVEVQRKRKEIIQARQKKKQEEEEKKKSWWRFW